MKMKFFKCVYPDDIGLAVLMEVQYLSEDFLEKLKVYD
jgi:hypothetical protein